MRITQDNVTSLVEAAETALGTLESVRDNGQGWLDTLKSEDPDADADEHRGHREDLESALNDIVSDLGNVLAIAGETADTSARPRDNGVLGRLWIVLGPLGGSTVEGIIVARKIVAEALHLDLDRLDESAKVPL